MAPVTFEQPRELNHFLNPASTFAQCWAVTKAVIPFFFLLAVMTVEMNWVDGKPVTLWTFLAPFAMLLIFPPALIPMTWLENRFKKALVLREENIRLRTGPLLRIPWRNVRGFQLEPAGPNGEFSMLTVKFTLLFGAIQSWKMLLADAAQREALVAELKKHGQTCVEVAGSKPETPAPAAKKTMPGFLHSGWPPMLGLLLIMHGLPLFLVGLNWPKPEHAVSHSGDLNPYAVAFLSHFHTRNQLRCFFIVTGAILTLTGVAGWMPFFLSFIREIKNVRNARRAKKQLMKADGAGAA